jgi:glucose/arabinose dehydrogenase
LELADGSLVIAEGSGRLTRLMGDDAAVRKQIAGDLNMPLALAMASPNAVYVLEAGAAQITRVNLQSGKHEVVAKGLDRPNGLTVDAGGNLYVIEAGQQRLLRIDAKTWTRTTVATGLPVGAPGLSAFSAGLAAGREGVLYVSSDIENSVYRLTPR